MLVHEKKKKGQENILLQSRVAEQASFRKGKGGDYEFEAEIVSNWVDHLAPSEQKRVRKK